MASHSIRPFWLTIAILLCLLVGPRGWVASATEVPELPPRASLWRDEAQKRYARGDLPGALKALQSAVASAPHSAQLRFMVGNAKFRLERFGEAALDYARAAELRPEHPDTWLSLGFAQFYAGQLDSAVTAWEWAVHLSPGMVLARLALAVGYQAQGESFFAGLQLMTALELDPECRDPARLEADVRWREVATTLLEAIKPAERTR